MYLFESQQRPKRASNNTLPEFENTNSSHTKVAPNSESKWTTSHLKPGHVPLVFFWPLQVFPRTQRFFPLIINVASCRQKPGPHGKTSSAPKKQDDTSREIQSVSLRDQGEITEKAELRNATLQWNYYVGKTQIDVFMQKLKLSVNSGQVRVFSKTRFCVIPGFTPTEKLFSQDIVQNEGVNKGKQSNSSNVGKGSEK